MILITPTTITPAMITACNVPENDYAAWSSGTSYTAGNRCIYSHKIYECLIANSNAQPDLNTGGLTPKWLDTGYDNRWKMFDAVVGSQTSQATNISVTVTPGMIDSIALLDVDADSIEITMVDPIEGTVYHDTVDMVMKGTVVDAYTYFFSPIITDDAAVLLGIPPYASAAITVSITKTGGTAKVGTLIFGMKKSMGGTRYNPTIGIIDYSKKEVDAFGNYVVLQRTYSKRMSCELLVDNTMVDDLQKTLAGYRATPLVWVGDDEGTFSSMIIYGFYKSFSISIPYPTSSLCSLEIEGLS